MLQKTGSEMSIRGKNSVLPLPPTPPSRKDDSFLKTLYQEAQDKARHKRRRQNKYHACTEAQHQTTKDGSVGKGAGYQA